MTTNMHSTPSKEGMVPTSTPLNEFHDSGYFESSAKSYVARPYHTLSPVKEASPLSKRFCHFLQTSGFSDFKTPYSLKLISKYQSIQDEGVELSPPDVVKELKFNESSDFSESWKIFGDEDSRPTAAYPQNYQYQNNLNLYSRQPLCHNVENNKANCVLNNLSNKVLSCKSKKVDFIAQLRSKNCKQILSDLLSYFPAEDICRMKGVSRTWKEIILEDTKANTRRKEFIKKMQAERENRLNGNLSTSERCERYDRTTVLPKLILCNVTNVSYSEKISIKSYNTKFDSFVKEGKNLQNGSLMKCPKCSYAAKAQSGDEYICTDCRHVFCKKCLCPFVNNHDCPKLQVPMFIIGSKQSKKNLRRL